MIPAVMIFILFFEQKLDFPPPSVTLVTRKIRCESLARLMPLDGSVLPNRQSSALALLVSIGETRDPGPSPVSR